MRRTLIMFIISMTALVLYACGNKPIDTVKNGTLDIDETVTIGNLIDNYELFKQTYWKEGTDNNNRILVKVEGDFDLSKFCNYNMLGTKIEKPDENIEGVINKYPNIHAKYVAIFAIAANDSKKFNLLDDDIVFEGIPEENKFAVNAFKQQVKLDNGFHIVSLYKGVPEQSVYLMLWTLGGARV